MVSDKLACGQCCKLKALTAGLLIAYSLQQKMKDFRNVKVWEKSHQLTLVVYQITRSFPDDEKYGLVSQLRRSVSSIPANIAEGCGRGSDNDFARFIQVAIGSASETEYHFLLAKDLGFIDAETWKDLNNKINEIKRMLINLNKKLRS